MNFDIIPPDFKLSGTQLLRRKNEIVELNIVKQRKIIPSNYVKIYNEQLTTYMQNKYPTGCAKGLHNSN